ncbi:MaoC family dehydratase N-terminal domain-containing protein [Streptomyces sp. HSW2009]|uniref:MaoC family dehydratase N-terminal domain-containing protein n=1 Tax=Streptomyces sp. HSW2009 TaxID=3142890 RepID=UPI0032EF1A60
MPLDTSYVGRVYPPTEPYEVGREKIREFAAAVGDTHPVFVDPQAARALGHLDVIAPPTFIFTLAQRATDQVVHDPELGLDYSRVVHGDQRFVYSRPIYAGDRLTVVVHVDNIKTLAGNDVVDLRGEVDTDTGEHVVTVYLTLVSRAAG